MWHTLIRSRNGKVIVTCPLCAHALSSASMLKHLRREHPEVTVRGRSEIIDGLRREFGWPERREWR